MPYVNPAEQRAYQLEFTRKRRNQLIAAMGGKCQKCGRTEALEFHHRDRRTKITHRFTSWAMDRALAEASKCDLLCEKCHKEETREQLSKPVPHGTKSGYSHHGCRCTECTDAAARYQRTFRENHESRRPL